MNSDYNKVWNAMNDLEMVISKVISAREMIDVANECCSKNEQERAERMTMAAYEFLGYFIEEFDEKFKLAWKETVVKQKEEDPCMPPWGHSDLEYLSKHKETLTCDKDDSSPECKGAWNSFWEENYYPEQHSEYYYDHTRNDPDRPNPFIDKVVKWQLPVEMHPSGEAFVIFPDDLMEAANLEEGDTVEWIDRGDGSYVLKKVTQTLGSDEC